MGKWANQNYDKSNIIAKYVLQIRNGDYIDHNSGKVMQVRSISSPSKKRNTGGNKW